MRVDSALYAGYTVPPYYDSLIAKLIVHDVDRATCIRRAGALPGRVVIDGIPSSVPLLRAIFAHRRRARRASSTPAGSAGSWPAGASELDDRRASAGIGLARS